MMQRALRHQNAGEGDVSATSPLKRQSNNGMVSLVKRLRKSAKIVSSGGVKAAANNATDALLPPSIALSSNTAEESEEVTQLRAELAEVVAAIAREKRARQKMKDQLEKSQHELTATERELEAINKKIEHATQLVTASEAHNRADLQLKNQELDEQLVSVREELQAAENELKQLHAQVAQKHQGKLQRDVAKIRSSDDNKKIAAWKKKIATIEASVVLLRSEVADLKRGSGGSLLPFNTQSNVEADNALEQTRKAFAAQLAKIQDDIVREARAAQETHSKSLDDLIKKNQGLNVEVAHLEQQRKSKESDAKRLQADVDKLSKAIDSARKRRDAMELDRQRIVHEREAVVKDTEQLQNKLQDALVALNQLMLMSSEAPQMHEKAWAQEKAALQATLNATQQKSKKLEQDIKALEGKAEGVRQDVKVEVTLCEEEADVLKLLDKLRHSLQSSMQHLAAVKHEEACGSESSQKDRIIRDLEGAIRTEKRHMEEMQSLNERLEKKLEASQRLLQKHGFDA